MLSRRNQLTFFGILMIMDAVLIIASFLLALWLRFYANIFPTPKGIPILAPYLIASVVVAVLWVMIFWMLGLYEKRGRIDADEEVYQLAKGTFVGIVAIMAFSFFYRDVIWSRLVMVLATAFSFLLLALQRQVAVRVYRRLIAASGMGLNRAALIGTGPTAQSIFNQLVQHPEFGYRVECLIDINGCCGTIKPRKKIPIEHIPQAAQLSELIDKYQLDCIFIILPNNKQAIVAEIVASAEHRPVELKFVPDIQEVLGSDTSVSKIGNIPVIGLRQLQLTAWDLLIKRGFDLLFALLAIAALSPLLLLLALLVKLTSKGPVLYAQERVGYDGRTFMMYKYRSMRTNAESATGPVWATEDDPRRTPIGPCLRKYSLDELPQFFNVIKGDMSLVGPRPERPFFVAQFTDSIPRYASRHKMKSGVTGWAQVNGWRGDTSIMERTRFDIFYIEHWSLFFDIKILFKTAIQVIFPKNAY